MHEQVACDATAKEEVGGHNLVNRGCTISCHDEIISNEDLAEEAGKDVEQIQHAADSCVNLWPIVDLVVCHSMPLAVYGSTYR